MASKAAAQIRQGSVGLGRQEEKEMGQVQRPRKKKRGVRSQPKQGDQQQIAVEDQAYRRVLRTGLQGR